MGYWENRQADLMYGYMQSAEDAAAEIARAYEAAAAYTRQEIEKIFQRFTGQYGLSDAAARRILRNVRDLRSLDSLRSAVEASGENADELLAEMNSGAYAARMSRWEDVQASLDDVMQRVYRYEQQVSSECYRGVVQQSYLDTIAGVQEQVGFSFSFAEINPEEIDTVMNTPFLGRNYSQRIWNNTQAVADSVREEMLVGVMTGKSQRDMARDITERFGVGASNARRLVRTEAAFVSGEAQAKAYEECGADKYEFVATLDLRTSEVCQELDGQIFELKDKQVGVNYPPMHPYCRSTTIIHIDDEVEQGLEGRRIARNPVTGRNEYVDASTTYEEWAEGQGEETPKVHPVTDAQRDEYTRRREERLAARRATAQRQNTPEAHGIEYDFHGHDERFARSKEVIDSLSERYRTRLERVTTGAEKAAGDVDMSGARMRLSSNREVDAIHEFAHTMANSQADRYGLTQDGEFWNEIRRIRREYRRDVGDDASRWISTYEHSSRSIDEFFAEAFTHAKMRELGIELPGNYGNDFTYSQQVLYVVDRYFGRGETVADAMYLGTSGVIAESSWIHDPVELSRVIREAIEAPEPVYAEDLRGAMRAVETYQEYYDVALHGEQFYTEYEGTYRLTAEELGTIIRGRRDYQMGDIRLLSCSTGATDDYNNCFAQQLANYLGVNVYAPVDLLYIHNGVLTVGKQRMTMTEGFRLFTPRR